MNIENVFKYLHKLLLHFIMNNLPCVLHASIFVHKSPVCSSSRTQHIYYMHGWVRLKISSK